MVQPASAVNAPPIKPPKYSLLTAVEAEGTLLNDLPRMTEFNWQPDVCSGGGVVDPCSPSGITPVQNPAVINNNPFGIWVGAKCSAFGWADFDFKDKADRLMTRAQSYWIEREFWRGDQAQASGWNNRYLTSAASDVLTDGPTAILTAFVCLEQGLAQCSYGAPGYIHATAQAVTNLFNLNLVFKEDGLIRSGLGTIVVPGSGYDGSPPAGIAANAASQWMYATSGPVIIRLGEVAYTSKDINSPAAVDIANNNIYLVSDRLAAVSYDQCCLYGAEISLASCGFNPEGS